MILTQISRPMWDLIDHLMWALIKVAKTNSWESTKVCGIISMFFAYFVPPYFISEILKNLETISRMDSYEKLNDVKFEGFSTTERRRLSSSDSKYLPQVKDQKCLLPFLSFLPLLPFRPLLVVPRLWLWNLTFLLASARSLLAPFAF